MDRTEWQPLELREGGVYDVTLSKSVRGVWTVRIKQGNTTLYSTTYMAFILGSFPEKSLFRFSTPAAQTIFIDKDMGDSQNILAGIFEHAVADYLREKYGYSVIIRFKPPYLSGKEIDVYAEKMGRSKTITVCECKLRMNNSEITIDEIAKFNDKVQEIRKFQSMIGVSKFFFWFVTNADVVNPEAVRYAKGLRIQLKKARLSNNWKKRADWKVESLIDL